MKPAHEKSCGAGWRPQLFLCLADPLAAAGPAAARSYAEIGELLLELGDAAAVDRGLLATGPGRMGVRVDVELQRGARGTPGRIGLELGAVRHHDRDLVIVGMNTLFHRFCPVLRGARIGRAG